MLNTELRYKYVGDFWICVNEPSEKRVLADLLSDYGFDVPYEIDYCLAHNELYSLKYRVCGGAITVFIKKLPIYGKFPLHGD